jgi:hypothetical protein
MTNHRPHWNPRPDSNQRDVIHALHAGNIRAWDISRLTDRECPGDIVCYGWGVWGVFELKTGEGEVSERQARMADIVPVVRGAGDIFDWYAQRLGRVGE